MDLSRTPSLTTQPNPEKHCHRQNLHGNRLLAHRKQRRLLRRPPLPPPFQQPLLVPLDLPGLRNPTRLCRLARARNGIRLGPSHRALRPGVGEERTRAAAVYGRGLPFREAVQGDSQRGGEGRVAEEGAVGCSGDFRDCGWEGQEFREGLGSEGYAGVSLSPFLLRWFDIGLVGNGLYLDSIGLGACDGESGSSMESGDAGGSGESAEDEMIWISPNL